MGNYKYMILFLSLFLLLATSECYKDSVKGSAVKSNISWSELFNIGENHE